MKRFREHLREHAMKIIEFEKRKMKLLTNKQQTSYENAKIFCIYLKINMPKVKKILQK